MPEESKKQIVSLIKGSPVKNRSKSPDQLFQEPKSAASINIKAKLQKGSSKPLFQEQEEIPAKDLEPKLIKEYRFFEDRFKYPTGKRSKQLMTVDKICQEYGIPSTRIKSDSMKYQRCQIEHKFWLQGIHKILDGFTERDFDDQFIRFILSIDFAQITDQDKQVIFSSLLKYNTLSERT